MMLKNLFVSSVPCNPIGMSTLLHEAMVLLFRNRPDLAPELLRRVFGIELPPFAEVRVASAELSEAVPREHRADLIVLLLDGKPVLAIVLEVQLSRDPDKHTSWPGYLIGARARYECPTCLLVVCADEAVARWCARPIETGHPGFVLRPLVLGPDAVPIVTEPEQAAAMPELSVLSAIAHGKGEHGFAIALAALAAARGLDVERATLYDDLVLFWLNEAARSKLEELMERGRYEYQSDIVRRHVAQGRAEGRDEGRAEAKAQDVLTVLEARGLDVSPELRRCILECTDLATLDRWLRRAVVIAEAGKLLNEH
jgi:Arc/MetJ-type ribon-helix-helix transcriptional regulator